MSRSKAPLACVWHKERFFTVGPMPRNSVGGLALGFHAIKSERIYHADSHNLPCVWNLYKRTLALLIGWLLALYAQSALYFMANRTYMAS